MKTGQYWPLVQRPSQGSVIFAPDGASAFGNTSFHCRQEMEKDSGGQNWRKETMSLRRQSANAANAASMQMLQFCKAFLHFPLFYRSNSFKTLHEQLSWDSEGVEENVGAFCFADLVCWTNCGSEQNQKRRLTWCICPQVMSLLSLLCCTMYIECS